MLPDSIWKYVLLFCGCFFLFTGPLQANKPEVLWQKGNTFYAQKQYDSALFYFQQIERQGYTNAALYYNMGNVYYRIGSIAPSVLYYEKALFEDPTNKIIKDNLTLAQSRVALPIAPSQPVFFISWWDSFTILIAFQVWAGLMLLCFLAALWLLYKQLKEKGGLNYIGRWLSFALAGLAVCGIFFYASYQARTQTDKAVVMKDNTPFFNAPNESQSGGQLPEGAVVRIQEEKGDWFSATLPNGSTAWIQAKNMAKVQD